MIQQNQSSTLIDGTAADLGGPRTAALLERLSRALPWQQIPCVRLRPDGDGVQLQTEPESGQTCDLSAIGGRVYRSTEWPSEPSSKLDKGADVVAKTIQAPSESQATE